MVNWQGWFSILSLLNFLFPDAIVFMLITAKRKRPITCGKFFKGNNSILTFMFCIEFSILIYHKRKFYKAWNSKLSHFVAITSNSFCEKVQVADCKMEHILIFISFLLICILTCYLIVFLAVESSHERNGWCNLMSDVIRVKIKHFYRHYWTISISSFKLLNIIQSLSIGK